MNRPNPQSQEGTVPEPRNFDQSMADHEHGLRFVDDEGRCLACSRIVLQDRLKEVERQRDEAESKLRIVRERSSVKACEAAEHRAEEAESALSERDRQVREAMQEVAAEIGAIEADNPDAPERSIGRVIAYRNTLARLARLTHPSSTPLQQDPEVGEAEGHDFELVTAEELIKLTIRRCQSIEEERRPAAKGKAGVGEREFARGEIQVAAHLRELLEEPIRTALTQPEADPEVPRCGEDDYERVARAFHGIYEATAPDHGYETRPESRVAWADVPEKNRALMIGTVRRLTETGVIAIPDCHSTPELLGERGPLRPASKAHLELVKAVLLCLEKGIWPETIRRFVDEELAEAAASEKGDGK